MKKIHLLVLILAVFFCTNNVIVAQTQCTADFSTEIDNVNFVVWLGHSGTGIPTDYYWEFGDGETSKEPYPQHQYPKEGIYNICLTIYNDTSQCFDKVCQEVQVGTVNTSTCFADFNVELIDLEVQCFNGFSSDINQVHWDFGDGSTSDKFNPIHVYKKPGIYEICVYVSDTLNGCESQVCKTFEVGTIDCLANFEPLVDNTTKKVEFINTSIGSILKWSWDLGDGTTSYEPSTSKLYDKYGEYKICLSVSNAGINCYDEICKVIELKDTSSVYCTPRFSYVVGSSTRVVKFSETSLIPFDKWYWDFGDGGISDLQAPIHKYERDGAYKVCLFVASTDRGCESSICKEVIVSTDTASTVLNASFSKLVDPEELSVELKDKSTGDPTNWYWTFGDGSYAKDQNPPKHVYPEIGVYPVCLTVYSSKTDAASTYCEKVTVGVKDCNVIASFSQFIDLSNFKVTFVDESKGNAEKWFWDFGDGGTSFEQNPIHRYANAGFYLVSLSVKNERDGCTDYYERYIQVGSIACKSNFVYNVDADNNTVNLESVSKGTIDKLYWQFDDGTSDYGPKLSHKFKSPGIHVIALTIVANKGTCTDIIRKAVQIGKVDCSADFTHYVDSASSTAIFKKEILGTSTRLLWDFGDGTFSKEENPTHTFKEPGYYTVGLNTYNETANCIDYKEKVVLIGEKGIDCEADFYFQTDSLDVRFYDNSKGDGLGYIWSFGDGGLPVKLKNPLRKFPYGGYFKVCLTIHTSSGIVNTRCKEVAVAPPDSRNCLTEFSYTVDDANLTVKYLDKSLGEPDGWYWKFGDETSSNEQNPEKVYSEAGLYKVRLVSGNSTTGCKNKAWHLIPVGVGNTGLEADFGYEIEPLRLKTGGYPVDFIGVSSGKPARYLWDFDDGNVDSTNISPTHIYDNTGIYNVCFTVEDQVTEESDTDCEIIDVFEVSIDGNNIQSIISLGNYPNPFTNSTNIFFELPQKTNVTIEIFDESGKLITTLINTNKNAGMHRLLWNAENLGNGLYYIKLKTNEGLSKTKMLIKQ